MFLIHFVLVSQRDSLTSQARDAYTLFGILFLLEKNTKNENPTSLSAETCHFSFVKSYQVYSILV